MARTITAATQDQLDAASSEVIIVLEIFWGGDKAGPSHFYADREITASQVQAKILTMSTIDEIVQVSGGGQSAEVTVVLDDTAGDIKAIFDVNDVHKVPVRIWFYALNTDFDLDKFSVFLGQINSPVSWHAGNKEFAFSIVNRIEDAEVGFSAEEGNFANLTDELIGQPWPLCFGTTINVRALRAVPSISGSTTQGIGIADFTLANRIKLAKAITCPQTPIGYKCKQVGFGTGFKTTCSVVFETDVNCLQARCVEIERLQLQKSEQEALEFSSLIIDRGENFPQGQSLKLDIGGAVFTGFFDGTVANRSNVFKITSREHPDIDAATGKLKQDPLEVTIKSKCPSSIDESQDSDLSQTEFGTIFSGNRASRLSWELYRDVDRASFFWAEGGSNVTLASDVEIIYIANILPSTILRVAAWRTIGGARFLLTVPSSLYTVRQTNYVGYQVMEIVFSRPLSKEDRDTGGGWEDDIFISQTSSIGRNPVSVISYLINTYTDYATDTGSFADTTTDLAKYPFDFCLLRRPNILQLLQQLAQRSRCALWQKEDTFFIKYLAKTPTPIATLTESDVLADDSTRRSTLQISLSKTEELVTKLTATWQDDHSLPEPKKLILRHNVSGKNGIKYGTHDRTEDYFCYAFLDLVRKSATFWLIRWANTWKRINMSVSLEFMKLEPFDDVTIDLSDVSSSPFTGVIEKAILDSSGKQINLEIWTPIRAGEDSPYDFAFPANISENAIFPTIDAVNANEAGSGNEPNFSTIAPPGHPLRTELTGVFRGFSLSCNGNPVSSFVTGECRQDHGDGRPSDINDTLPVPDVPTDVTGDVSGGTSPISNGAGDGFFSTEQFLRDQLNKDEQDGGKAREGNYIDFEQNGGDDNDFTQDPTRDYLDDLPDPDDLDPDKEKCQITVKVTGFGIVAGFKGLCFQQHAARTEIYVYDSLAAAESFCATIKANSNCGSQPPCTQCVNSCLITGECDVGDEGAGNLIAFRGDPAHPDISFLGTS